jgi:hypothetical protein
MPTSHKSCFTIHDPHLHDNRYSLSTRLPRINPLDADQPGGIALTGSVILKQEGSNAWDCTENTIEKFFLETRLYKKPSPFIFVP